MPTANPIVAGTSSALAIIIISTLLLSAVYNFNRRAQKYTVLMWLYICTGLLYLLYNMIKFYIAVAPDSHITNPNMCQFYWQVYQLYIFGKLLMYLFYCNRIYQAFKGSAFEMVRQNYKILVGSVSFFYVGISLAFFAEVLQWGDQSTFPLDSPQITTAQIETWDDCVYQTDWYARQTSMIIKIVILYLGEATFSIILLRLYVRKVLQLVGHLNFSSIEVSMNSVHSVKKTNADASNVSVDATGDITGDAGNTQNGALDSPDSLSAKRSTSSTGRTRQEMEDESESGNTEMDDAFLQVAVKSTILVIFSIFSSILASVAFDFVGRFLLDLDCAVNFVCMYLTFVFAKKWYAVICYGTHKCCWEIGVKCCFKCCMVDCCVSCQNGCDCRPGNKEKNQEEELSAVVDNEKVNGDS